MKLLDTLLAAGEDLTRIRRDIHQHPELCFQEQRTSDLIAQQLEAWGIPVIRGLGTTGVVGVVKGGDSPRAIGLRADIDALPMTEHNHFPHASVHPGKMHACGHDGHTTMLLAAAKHLAQHRNFDGTVYLIFQPAEEGGGGAREMIKDGLWQRCPMDAVFGIHNWPGMPAGTFSLASGPVFASSNEFKIVLKGKGAHGAMPHLGLDPVPAACQLVQAFQTIINRNKRPIDTGVISVTMIHAGEATNVIPETVTLEGTVRTFTVAVLDLIERRMKELSENLAAGFELQCEFQFRRNYPPTVNHARETEFVRRTLEGMGAKVERFEPTMGAEDFSYYLLDKPGCYFLIGNGEGQHREGGHGLGPCTLHNPSYDFNDQLIPVGGSMWVNLVEAWFKEQQA
ncbi:M20 aminoacylase family protein [Inhella proteolytica]|uniref:Amidohydrolase n=1 Tax=Inhella proteolytica TaxID=2795029 RepID=A0A931NFQ0_9BURK|nr:M20 aminoacylase family protein [Inhella proteolytica]MBH9579047.1 amidohydrolase [Inhella proteolytica]